MKEMGMTQIVDEQGASILAIIEAGHVRPGTRQARDGLSSQLGLVRHPKKWRCDWVIEVQ